MKRSQTGLMVGDQIAGEQRQSLVHLNKDSTTLYRKQTALLPALDFLLNIKPGTTVFLY